MWQAGLDWWVATGILVIMELLTGTFYLLVISVGTAAGGFAHLGGLAVEWQLLIAALIALAGVAMVRRFRFGGGKRGVRGNRVVHAVAAAPAGCACRSGRDFRRDRTRASVE